MTLRAEGTHRQQQHAAKPSQAAAKPSQAAASQSLFSLTPSPFLPFLPLSLPNTRSGYYKADDLGGFIYYSSYDGYAKPSQLPPAGGQGPAVNIPVFFDDVGLRGSVEVFDAWEGKVVGTYKGEYTAAGVAFHDTALLILTPAK